MIAIFIGAGCGALLRALICAKITFAFKIKPTRRIETFIDNRIVGRLHHFFILSDGFCAIIGKSRQYESFLISVPVNRIGNLRTSCRDEICRVFW